LAIRLAIYCADDADTDRYEVARYRSLWASTPAELVERTHPPGGARRIARDAGMGHHHPGETVDLIELDGDLSRRRMPLRHADICGRQHVPVLVGHSTPCRRSTISRYSTVNHIRTGPSGVWSSMPTRRVLPTRMSIRATRTVAPSGPYLARLAVRPSFCRIGGSDRVRDGSAI